MSNFHFIVEYRWDLSPPLYITDNGYVVIYQRESRKSFCIIGKATPGIVGLSSPYRNLTPKEEEEIRLYYPQFSLIKRD